MRAAASNFGVEMQKHWFFDLDGTLFDTEEDIKLAWLATIRSLGLECPRFDELYRTGPSLGDMAAILFPDAPSHAALAASIRRAFAPIYDTGGFPSTLPYPQAVHWIGELKSAGARLYVATNKRMVPTRLILAKFDFLDFFDGIYTSDMYVGARSVPPGVPTDRAIGKAQILSLAIAERGIDPSDAVMVGDTILDVEAGKANGMHTVGVAWGYGTRDELSSADEIVG